MTNEQRYKEALLHVIKFINGNGYDFMKPLNADYANNISKMCRFVIDGDTTEEAINKLNS
jgi:hypothetical protein